MPTRNVVLTDRHEKLIETLVQTGKYQNASEVLRAGLRLVEREEAQEAERLAALRSAVAEGIAASEAGNYKRFPDARSLTAYLRKRTDSILNEKRD